MLKPLVQERMLSCESETLRSRRLFGGAPTATGREIIRRVSSFTMQRLGGAVRVMIMCSDLTSAAGRLTFEGMARLLEIWLAQDDGGA